jgi:hypothetical protein
MAVGMSKSTALGNSGDATAKQRPLRYNHHAAKLNGSWQAQSFATLNKVSLLICNQSEGLSSSVEPEDQHSSLIGESQSIANAITLE